MRGKIKGVFRLLWHDQGMVTTHKKITLGHSYLQGVWSQSTPTNDARAYPDRRLSVCETGCVTTTMTTGVTTGIKPSSISARSDREPGSGRDLKNVKNNDTKNDAKNDKTDSLLGSLLADTFMGAVFGPLLPLWAQAVDWSNVVDAADEVWLDRRNVPAPAPARPMSHSFF